MSQNEADAFYSRNKEVSDEVRRETGFRLGDIRADIRSHRRYIQKRFSKKLRLIEKLIDLQSRLTGIYLKEIWMKERMHLAYKNNVVVNNALLNQPYISNSILVLTIHTFYGSARVIERQFFEALIIGKFSEYDSGIIMKWESKTENDPASDIKITNDVFNKLHDIDISAIKDIWRQLNVVTHPGKYAQQVPRLTDPVSKKDLRNRPNRGR